MIMVISPKILSSLLLNLRRSNISPRSQLDGWFWPSKNHSVLCQWAIVASSFTLLYFKSTSRQEIFRTTSRFPCSCRFLILSKYFPPLYLAVHGSQTCPPQKQEKSRGTGAAGRVGVGGTYAVCYRLLAMWFRETSTESPLLPPGFCRCTFEGSSKSLWNLSDWKVTWATLQKM